MIDVQTDQEKWGSEIDPARCVFINCPFDRRYTRLFDAIIFTVVSCGFNPRCTLEYETVSVQRMEKITEAIFSSKYSIHDLSRCKGEGAERYARFNMPLELGIAIAHRHMTRDKSERHDWFALVPKGHIYMKFVSDLAGYDLETHDNSEKEVVRCVVKWLKKRSNGMLRVNPKDVLDALKPFKVALKELRGMWGPMPPWDEILSAAEEKAPKRW